jgi:hypothetical protein
MTIRRLLTHAPGAGRIGVSVPAKTGSVPPVELDSETAAALIARVSTALCFADLAVGHGPDLKTVELTVRAFLR